jgi:hypothetical protein
VITTQKENSNKNSNPPVGCKSRKRYRCAHGSNRRYERCVVLGAARDVTCSYQRQQQQQAAPLLGEELFRARSQAASSPARGTGTPSDALGQVIVPSALLLLMLLSVLCVQWCKVVALK